MTWRRVLHTAARRPVLSVIGGTVAAGVLVEAHTAIVEPTHVLPRAYDADAIAQYWQRRPVQVVCRVVSVVTEMGPLIWSAVRQQRASKAAREADPRKDGHVSSTVRVAHAEARVNHGEAAVTLSETATASAAATEGRNTKIDAGMASVLKASEPSHATSEDNMAWAAYGARVRDALVRLGPCFIKLGQALSIRPDIIHPAMIHELQRLCDDVPAFDSSIAMSVIESELGVPVGHVLDGLDESTPPVAAASLGQVYKARLAGTDTEVAVKVQRPEMPAAVSLDLYLLRHWAVLMDAVKHLWTVQRPFDCDLVDSFGTAVFGELDYVCEAANQNEFRRMFQDTPSIHVPPVVSALTTRQVLVTEWVHGLRLIDSPPDTIKRLTPVGIECFLSQLLEHGFFHADPHPGNLLVDTRGRLVLIDFGLCARIDKPATVHMTHALVHLMQGKLPELLDDAVELGFLEADVDRESMLPSLNQLFSRAKLRGKALRAQGGSEYRSQERRMQLSAVSNELNHIFFDFPFRVPDYFALVTRALIVLEGIALAGNPRFDLFGAAYPFALRKAMSGMTSSERTAAARAVGQTYLTGNTVWATLYGAWNWAWGATVGVVW
eukprot:m.45239 g.45239  ORF g.45239 m.45239 type:complete len:607 (+) comp6628_c0_seq1:360-2180(+)